MTATPPMTQTAITRSLIIPVYCNELNIPSLLEALSALAGRMGTGFEVVFVVDGSPDASHQLLAEALGNMPFASQLVALSRNFGSFAAIRCGMEIARGRHLAVMAADLQEPPELVEEFFQVLEADQADVVFGQRKSRSENPLNRGLSNLFWYIYRKMVISDVPPGGVDVFGCNTTVRDAILSIDERNSSLVAQLFWVGYRRKFIPYDRRKRIHGKSAWNFSRRFQYMLDSIFSFSDFPIIALLWVGLFGCVASLGIGLIIFLAWLVGGIQVPGYTPIMLGMMFVGSMLLLAQGIIGGYLWRVAENTKQRPHTLIASQTDFAPKE